MARLLVEIGVEELPLGSLDVIYGELASMTANALKEARLAHGDIAVEATPRRIAVFIDGLAEKQSDEKLELRGPSVEKAYTPSGEPTPALNGFLRSKNASQDEIIVKDSPKGKLIVLEKKEKGKAAAKVLPAIIETLFRTLPFPKLMRWAADGFRFPRPIRWAVAILEKKVLRFRLGDVVSGDRTYGHRFLAPQPFKIKEAHWEQYQKSLKKAHVLLSLEQRKKFVRQSLSSKLNQKQIDEDLIHTTSQLVEEPFILVGRFSKTYLELPSEVLASCMKKNQKIFACYDAKGFLMSRFVAVLNGKRKGLARIQSEYENVLESRLRDAKYFYEQDTKEALEKRYPKLNEITYLGDLGTLQEKSERLVELAEDFCGCVGRLDLVEDLKRVARLAKCDLLTQLVYEFPDLQGIVGREYAIEAGEKDEVARAVGMQYLPKNLSDAAADLKKQLTPLGALFGILDRLDLLVGAFGSGIEPTGSQDPYALRRAGGGLMKLIRAFGFHFNLFEVAKKNLSAYKNKTTVGEKEVLEKLSRFFKERMLFESEVKAGTHAYEILQAVLCSESGDVAEIFHRFHVLTQLFENNTEHFIQAVKVVERTSNILKGMKESVPKEIRSELFQTQLERKLFDLLQSNESRMSELMKKKQYDEATIFFGQTFYAVLHEFFDQVLVNVPEDDVRRNRYALMKRVNSIYTEPLADLSVLSHIEEEQKP